MQRKSISIKWIAPRVTFWQRTICQEKMWHIILYRVAETYRNIVIVLSTHKIWQQHACRYIFYKPAVGRHWCVCVYFATTVYSIIIIITNSMKPWSGIPSCFWKPGKHTHTYIGFILHVQHGIAYYKAVSRIMLCGIEYGCDLSIDCQA